MKLLLQLQTFFNCGTIVIKNNRNEGSLRVNSIQELINVIIPHFDNYPLLSQKAADFYLFKQIINLIAKKVHLTEEGIKQIVNYRASMNKGLSDLQKSKFINYSPVARQIIDYDEIPNPFWLAGFASGEGCFLVNMIESNRNTIGQVIQLIFKISQHHRDKKLLELITKYMNCGAVYSHSENAFVYQVTKFEDINNKLIPFFKAHSILGIKQLDYQDFCKIATLISEGKHLTHNGLDKIKLIKDKMNTKRKYFKI
jgi:hypothetical protein